MKFSDFLQQIKTKEDFTSARKLFEHLGGEKKLGITLRYFQLLETGKQVPTPKVFWVISRLWIERTTKTLC